MGTAPEILLGSSSWFINYVCTLVGYRLLPGALWASDRDGASIWTRDPVHTSGAFSAVFEDKSTE